MDNLEKIVISINGNSYEYSPFRRSIYAKQIRDRVISSVSFIGGIGEYDTLTYTTQPNKSPIDTIYLQICLGYQQEFPKKISDFSEQDTINLSNSILPQSAQSDLIEIKELEQYLEMEYPHYRGPKKNSDFYNWCKEWLELNR